jgi:hypothetical protein
MEPANLPVQAASSKPVPLALPAPSNASALVEPKPLELPPEQQVATVLDSIKERTAGKKRAAEEDPQAPSKQAKGKAKCKAKAAPKPKPKAKASGKAKSKKPSVKVADANEQPAADHQQEPAIGFGETAMPKRTGPWNHILQGRQDPVPQERQGIEGLSQSH